MRMCVCLVCVHVLALLCWVCLARCNFPGPGLGLEDPRLARVGPMGTGGLGEPCFVEQMGPKWFLKQKMGNQTKNQNPFWGYLKKKHAHMYFKSTSEVYLSGLSLIPKPKMYVDDPPRQLLL